MIPTTRNLRTLRRLSGRRLPNLVVQSQPVPPGRSFLPAMECVQIFFIYSYCGGDADVPFSDGELLRMSLQSPGKCRGGVLVCPLRSVSVSATICAEPTNSQNVQA